MTAALLDECRACGKPVRPGSVICLGCGTSLVRAPQRRSSPMLLPAIVLGILLVVLLAYMADGFGADLGSLVRLVRPS